MSTQQVRTSIDEVLQSAVDSGAVPNGAAIAADRDGIIYEGAAGPRAAGGSDPASVDPHFRIMSMTKMVATVAALQLMERGDLDLDEPIETYRPEWAEMQVLDGFDGDTPRLRAPATQATVKHLVTHTSGLGYWFFSDDIMRWEAHTGTPNVLAGEDRVLMAPLLADPGTRYEYGINTDWLGKVVEAACGSTLDAYIAEHITGPLGMTETAFLMDERQRSNSTPVHLKSEDGRWEVSDIDLRQDPEYWAGGHGLHSTPRDYLKFQRMLLGNGTSPDGVTILSESTVDAAFTNQIGDIDFPPAISTADPASTCDFNAGPGWKWGYGLLLNTEDLPGMRRAYSGAWAGLLNTHFWVDRTTGVTGAIYTQFLPFVTPEAFGMYQDFERALYASLG
jgi:CubicO group peptidase (beta-lactamase class C family)